MPTCVVKGCRNRPESVKDRNESITFHRFPIHKAELMHKWLKSIGSNVLKDKVKVIHNTSVICSEHFEKQHLNVKNHRTRLLPEAVPTLFRSASAANLVGTAATHWLIAKQDTNTDINNKEECFETVVISQQLVVVPEQERRSGSTVICDSQVNRLISSEDHSHSETDSKKVDQTTTVIVHNVTENQVEPRVDHSNKTRPSSVVHNQSLEDKIEHNMVHSITEDHSKSLHSSVESHVIVHNVTRVHSQEQEVEVYSEDHSIQQSSVESPVIVNNVTEVHSQGEWDKVETCVVHNQVEQSSVESPVIVHNVNKVHSEVEHENVESYVVHSDGQQNKTTPVVVHSQLEHQIVEADVVHSQIEQDKFEVHTVHSEEQNRTRPLLVHSLDEVMVHNQLGHDNIEPNTVDSVIEVHSTPVTVHNVTRARTVIQQPQLNEEDDVSLLCLTPAELARQIVVVPAMQLTEDESRVDVSSLKTTRKRKLKIPSLCLDNLRGEEEEARAEVEETSQAGGIEKLVILRATSSKPAERSRKKKLLAKIPAEVIKEKKKGRKTTLVLPDCGTGTRNLSATNKTDVVCVTDVFATQQFCETQGDNNNLTGLCRVCASSDSFMLSIFGPLGQEQRLADKIHRFLPIQVGPDDQLPQQVCMKCVQHLNNFEQLVECSQEADLKLRLMLEAQQMYFQVEELLVPKSSDLLAEEEQKINDSIAATTPSTITCSECDKVFSKFRAYARHCYTIHKKKKCKACDQFFNTKQEIFQHKLKQHAIKCDCCGTSFVSINSMLNHLRREHPNFKSYSCELCNKSFNSKYGLSIHRECHQSERPFLCDTCGKNFKTKRKLKVHKCITSLGDGLPDNNTCNLCGKVYTLRSSLKRHLLRHEGERRFECNICNKKFFGSVNLKNHMVIHEKATLYECQMCVARYFHKRNMISHLKDKHSVPWNYKCPSCDAIFQTIDEVVIHRKTHDVENISLGISQVSEINQGACLDFQCKICDKYFENIYVLTYHFEDHVVRTQEDLNIKAVGEDGIYECHYCGEKMVSNWTMKRHLKRFHGEDLHLESLNFECEFCSKRFATKQQLRQHVYQHTGEKPYRCRYCNAGFRTHLAVKVHSRIHTGEVPYHCLKCPKKFRSSATLRIHQSVHDKPFCCSTCGQRFPKKVGYQKHLMLHASEGGSQVKKSNVFKCQRCDYVCKTKPAMRKHESSHEHEPTYLNL